MEISLPTNNNTTLQFLLEGVATQLALPAPQIHLWHVPDLEVGYPLGEHLQDSLDSIQELADYTFNSMLEAKMDMSYINFIVRGSSGAIMGTVFAMKFMEKLPSSTIRVIHIKKEGERSHNGGFDVADFNAITNVFVDDFIATGATIQKTIEKVREIMGESFSFDFLAVNRTVGLYDVDKIYENNTTKNMVSYFSDSVHEKYKSTTKYALQSPVLIAKL